MAAKTIKMCDMDIEIALKVLEMLNPGKVKVEMKPLKAFYHII